MYVKLYILPPTQRENLGYWYLSMVRIGSVIDVIFMSENKL